jgi:lysyl-tRNA synthetase class 2
VPRDEPLLQALRHGLPESYGVALGVDRLLMVITGNQRLAKCMTFGEVQ